LWLRFKIAIRNAFRNRRRSLLNVFMIASAVACIILFEGFTFNMVEGLRETTIETQTGHLQIASQSFWEKKKLRPKDNLIPNYTKILAELNRDKRIKYAAGRLEFFGLLSHGDESISTRVTTVDPFKERSRNKYFNFRKGRELSHKRPFEVAVGSGLAKKLSIETGSQVTVLTHTYDGIVNAMDFKVSGIFQTDIAEFDDNTLLMPLKTAQRLLDTKAVEQIVIGLNSSRDTKSVMESMAPKLSSLAPETDIKTWFQLATLYKQVSMFNSVQNTIIQMILMTLVLLSIANTVGMSIMERTGEIGTLRALGEQRASVVVQFLFEGFVLGTTGVLIGTLGGIGFAHFFNSLNIPIVFPGASSPIFIKIAVLFSAMAKAGISGIVITVLAALLPAYRSAKMNIVQALRHNI